MEQSDSTQDLSPNHYRNATRACRLLHVFCIVPSGLFTRTGPSFAEANGFVGENYISPATIHIILSKCKPIEPVFLREFLLHSRTSRSKSSLQMRFLTVLGQPGKAVLRFSWTELRNEFPRASSTNRASSAWDDTRQNPVPARLLQTGKLLLLRRIGSSSVKVILRKKAQLISKFIYNRGYTANR
jgi:hypothetical protein